MALGCWNAFLEDLRTKCAAGPFRLDTRLFAEFVGSLAGAERVPLLLHAYDRYREFGLCSDHRHPQWFDRSCYSLLISAILGSKIQLDRNEALEILHKSFHYCGHGSDIEPPLALAERAFRSHPYSEALFDAVLDYRETLRSTKSATAFNVKRKLNWILWHDPRRLEKKCCTRRIQLAIHTMNPQIGFAWQWLLRHTAPGLNSGPGKDWAKEAAQRLAQVGEREFLLRIDEWFAFPPEQTVLSPAGSAMLRLLVWYGSLFKVDESLPVLVRIAHVAWVKREPAQKVISALAWFLRREGGHQFEVEINRICREWSDSSSEVKRLEETYLPDRAAVRQQAERQAADQRRQALGVKWEARLSQLLLKSGIKPLRVP